MHMSREKRPLSRIEKAAIVGIAGTLGAGGVLVDRMAQRGADKPTQTQRVDKDAAESPSVPRHFLPDFRADAPEPEPSESVHSEEVPELTDKGSSETEGSFPALIMDENPFEGLNEDEKSKLRKDVRAQREIFHKRRAERLLKEFKKILPDISDVKYEYHDLIQNPGPYYTIYCNRLSGRGPIAYLVEMGQNADWFEGFVLDVANDDEENPNWSIFGSPSKVAEIAKQIKHYYPELGR